MSVQMKQLGDEPLDLMGLLIIIRPDELVSWVESGCDS